MVDEIKASELDPIFNFDSEPKFTIVDKGKRTIDVSPSVTITTTHIHPKELEGSKVEKCLFHSQMWVKGTPYTLLSTITGKRT